MNFEMDHYRCRNFNGFKNQQKTDTTMLENRYYADRLKKYEKTFL